MAVDVCTENVMLEGGKYYPHSGNLDYAPQKIMPSSNRILFRRHQTQSQNQR